MSTITQPQLIESRPKSYGSFPWWAAVISPLVIAPIWLAVSPTWLEPLQSFAGVLLILLLATAAYSDLTRRKIYNWATYTTLAWAIVINALPSFQSSGAIGLSDSLSGAAACFALMLVPYSLAHGGAGDVKIATAIGALVGTSDGFLTIAFTYIIAAVVITGWTIWTAGPFRLMIAMIKKFGGSWFPHLLSAPNDSEQQLLAQPIPLAPFFAIATLAVVFDVPAILRSL